MKNFISLIALILSCQLIYAQQFLAGSYPSDYHGTILLSGERYSKFLATAANNEIPIGSKVLITDINTKRSALVKINDKIEEPSVDFLLSDAVFKELGLSLDKNIIVTYKIISQAEPVIAMVDHMRAKGVESNMTLDQLVDIHSLSGEKYIIQIGAFSTIDKALKFVKNNQYILGTNETVSWINDKNQNLIKIGYGTFSDYHSAKEKLAYLKKMRLNGFIKQVKYY